jgi:hypothetical protein
MDTEGETDSILKVSLLAVVVFATAYHISKMMSASWEYGVSEDIVFDIVVGVLSIEQSLAYTYIVVVPVGLCFGLLLLFILDKSKKIQAPLVALFVLIFVASTILLEYRWTSETGVDWFLRFPLPRPAFILGLVFGFLLGEGYKPVIAKVHPAYRESIDSTKEFPRAAILLLAIGTFSTLVSFFDLHIGLINANSATTRLDLGVVTVVLDGIYQNYLFANYLPDILLNFTISIIFIVSLGMFVEYENSREVILIGERKELIDSLLTGLYDVSEEYEGEGISRQGRLKNESLKLENDWTTPEFSEDDFSKEGVMFKYKYPSLFSRWIIVNPQKDTIDDLTHDGITELKSKVEERSGLKRIKKYLLKPVLLLIPSRILSAFPDIHRTELVSRIDNSDVVVLIFSLSSYSRSNLNKYCKIYDIYEDDEEVDIIIVGMDPKAKFSEYADRHVEEPDSIKETSFKKDISENVLYKSQQGNEQANDYEVISAEPEDDDEGGKSDDEKKYRQWVPVNIDDDDSLKELLKEIGS